MLAEGRRRVAAAGLARPRRAPRGPGRGAALRGRELRRRSTFTYLLRYVDDPAATMRELARVVRPGGRVAMLEFAVPRAAAAARRLGGLGPRRAPARRPRRSRRAGARSAASSGRASARSGRSWPPDRLRGVWEGAGHRRRPGAAAQPRRRHRHVGHACRLRRAAPGVLRARSPAAGATTSRCSTRRTRPGTSATSRSAPRSTPAPSPGTASSPRSPRSSSRSGSARTRSTSSTAGRWRPRSRRRPRRARRRLDRRRSRDRDRRRAHDGPLDRRRSSPPAPSSSSRTTSSCSAAASTATPGSRSPGAPSRC